MTSPTQANSSPHTHFLIAHVPVWTFSIWHHFPHQYAEAPDVTSRAELAMLKSFWCCPPHRNLTALMQDSDRQCRSDIHYAGATNQSASKKNHKLNLTVRTNEAVYVGMLWSRPLMSRDRQKSDTLQTRLELTSTFLAARSRWTKFLSER